MSQFIQEISLETFQVENTLQIKYGDSIFFFSKKGGSEDSDQWKTANIKYILTIHYSIFEL